MREKLALVFCALTVMLVTTLAYLLAVRNNPPVATPAPTAPGTAQSPTQPAAEPAKSALPDNERGKGLFERLGCVTCHAVAGRGNPRHPLDGTGTRWNAAELQQWIGGTGAAAEQLSLAVRGRKQRYQQLPEEDLRALVMYLSGLK